MKKTPMTELRDKLLEEVQNLKENAQLNEHLKGYREALKNVANDIDAQMLRFENLVIADAYNADLYGGLSGQKKFDDGQDYYSKTFGAASYEDIDGDEGELNEKKMRYEVKEEGKILRVWDNQDKLWITKELPSMAIANAIADDFNKMENKDFRPIGLPNFEGINKRSCK